MIAAWMLFSVVCGALVVLAGMLLEPVIAATGRPRRGLWLTVVVCAALVLLLPLVRGVPAVGNDGAGRDVAAAAVAPSTEDEARSAASFASLSDAMGWAGRHWSTVQTRTGTWDTALLRAWIGVGAALFAFIVIGTRSRTRESRALPALTHAALGNEVVLSPVSGPAATGVLRPRILLPPWTLDLDPALRAIVLRHEAEHIAARDPALLLGAVVLLVLLPWHLPLWYAVHRLKLAIEVDCDARVLRAFPDVRRYARLLLLVSQQFRTSAPSFRSAHAGFTTLGSAHSNLRTRILVMTGSPARRFTLASLAQLAGAATLVATVAAMPAPDARAAAVDPLAANMPRVSGMVADGADIPMLQQPPLPPAATKPPVPSQPPRAVPPAPTRVPPAPQPATSPEPPSVVMPPSPKRPATPPEPPAVMMPPAPVPPAPPVFEQAPSLLRVKPPLAAVERKLSRKKEANGDVTLQEKKAGNAVPKVIRLKSAKQPPKVVRSKKPGVAQMKQSEDSTNAQVRQLRQVVRDAERQIRLLSLEQQKREGSMKKMQKQPVKSPLKLKRPDSTGYDGRRQDTNVVPRK